MTDKKSTTTISNNNNNNNEQIDIHRRPPLTGDLKDGIDRKQSYIMGIDEAGRGPVLGPLVYGACFAPLKEIETIKKMKFNDSKKLTEQQREQLFIKIIKSPDVIGFVSDINTPEYLSEKMCAKMPTSLDVISHGSAFKMIRTVLDRGYNVQELYLDTVGPALKYQTKLQIAFPSIGKIVVSSKADSIYPIVSAGSIVAKVLRDVLIANTSFAAYQGVEISRDFGSGYPSDPSTKKWLREHRDNVFGYPDNIIRFSWKTTINNLASESSIHWVSLDKQSHYFSTKRKRSSFFQDNQIDNQSIDF
ncbi:ribonuclease H2 subunit A [Cavenderia fasciculata]|uniref:Ribonuclease n=1 Tax=Cavenderia fasciculata TaxID=261658 RepID=F4PV37_CACFS|nr:ribonuclease H2 subunit A [Cavenderia fasciculata]EGG21153.1 ribonuclease H2 subunit A [Cavenderia fasciculata]|eukprot:XP_004359003.1 ribonuclease H2 subunit A [Cavenderia fasciculata]